MRGQEGLTGNKQPQTHSTFSSIPPAHQYQSFPMRPFALLCLLLWPARAVGMEDEGEYDFLSEFDFPTSTLQLNLLPVPPFAPTAYFPPHSTPFTPKQISDKLHKLNHSTSLTSRIYHPLHAVLEFPETTEARKRKIAHIFTIDPQSFRPPKQNIQYSVNHEGATSNQTCNQLPHPTTPKTYATGRTEWLTCTSITYSLMVYLPISLVFQVKASSTATSIRM